MKRIDNAHKVTLILASCFIGSEVLMYVVHQLLLGQPYRYIFLTVPAFFVVFEFFFCFMGYKSMRHGKNTRWFMAFKMVKMLFAVLFVACYIMLSKTDGANSGLLVRFFAEYLVFLVAETYIGTKLKLDEKYK